MRGGYEGTKSTNVRERDIGWRRGGKTLVAIS